MELFDTKISTTASNKQINFHGWKESLKQDRNKVPAQIKVLESH